MSCGVMVHTWGNLSAVLRKGQLWMVTRTPSGLDADTGVAYAPTVRADVTVTLGLPKPGLLTADGPRLAGEVWAVDIGVPFEAYAAAGVEVPSGLYSSGARLRL